MKLFKTALLISVSILSTLSTLSTLSLAQCIDNGSQGTNCVGPLAVMPTSGDNVQSSIILVDIGLPNPSPAAKTYLLSIIDGSIQESDNNGQYHTLVGATGQQGIQGIQGIQGNPGQQGPVGSSGVIVGTTLTFTLSCPKNKGRGSIPAGFGPITGCTMTVVGVQQP